MTFTFTQYDDFDPALSQPLYGWVREFQDGAVPSWVVDPTVNETDVRELLAIPYGDDVDPKQLPAGVTHEQVGSVQDRYRIEPETYLRLTRSHANRTNRDGPHRAVFSLRMSGESRLGSVGPQETTPNRISKRLRAVKETSTWEDVVDANPDVQFDGWKLIYEIGNRGGIRDVFIAAKLHSSGAIHIPTPTEA